jgi:hypothetical protein
MLEKIEEDNHYACTDKVVILKAKHNVTPYSKPDNINVIDTPLQSS